VSGPGVPHPPGLDATIVLVRHGESDWITKGLFQGQGDSPLSPLGRRQAGLVARRLVEAHRPPVLPIPRRLPSAIVHAPLGRATETAHAIAAAFAAPAADRRPGTFATPAEIPLRPDPAFLEIGQGEWEGVPGREIEARWGDVLRTWREDPLRAWAPGGESLPEVDARVRDGLTRLLERLATEPPLAAADRTPVLGYADEPPDLPWAVLVAHDGVFKVTTLALLDLPLARFWMLPFALCGISVVELRGGHVRLRTHNATDHLAEIETEAVQQRAEELAKTGAL